MEGLLFIVSSPSGGGKTTIIKRTMELLQERDLRCHFSVSHTTRGRRPSEREGRDYHFVDRETFMAMVDRGEFLEWAEYAGNLYGTSRKEVLGRLEAGIDVFLDIDVQGAQQVKTSIPDAVKVFIYPPSYEELRRRLVERRQDSPEAIEKRLRWAARELRFVGEFDYAIINDRLDMAVEAMFGICLTEHHRLARIKPRLDTIREAFQRSLEEDFTP